VQDALNTQVVEIKEDKAKLEETIEALEDSKAEQGAVVQTTLLAKKMVESNKTEKKTLLAETKGQEAIYTANLKNKEKEIGSQFKYNTYVRDFFKHNPGRSLKEVILCWNYKKGVPGNHTYHPDDLKMLE
jgi:hypothetical protein